MTTTTTTEERQLTRFGITGPESLWRALGYEVYNNTDEPKPGLAYREANQDAYLHLARVESGHTDLRALTWLLKWRSERTEEQTRSTAVARLAEAITKGVESRETSDDKLARAIYSLVKRLSQ